ncbi:recombinase family protein, partial [Shinella granuli]|uniref:recombinase family protein n=1 Tax=Shinella granuli TaxID=323621 RepID=UPI003CD057F2
MSEFNGKTDKPRLMTSIGYARVSTGEQDTALQLDALRKAGCERLFEDKASGVKTDRPGLAEAIRYVRDGDTLTVWKLDRLGRSMKHLIEIITELEAKGVGFRSITENIDTTTSGGRLVFHLFGALAQFERDLIRNEHVPAASRRGTRPTRWPTSRRNPGETCQSPPASGGRFERPEAAARVKIGKPPSTKLSGPKKQRHPRLNQPEFRIRLKSRTDIPLSCRDA